MTNLPPLAADDRADPTRIAAAGAFVTFCLAIAVLFWIAGLPLMQPDRIDDFGIASILPWQYWVAVGCVTAGFAVSLIHPGQSNLLRLSALILLVLILHATPPIVYGTLRYSWSWKHIGIIDFIQRTGGVDRMPITCWVRASSTSRTCPPDGSVTVPMRAVPRRRKPGNPESSTVGARPAGLFRRNGSSPSALARPNMASAETMAPDVATACQPRSPVKPLGRRKRGRNSGAMAGRSLRQWTGIRCRYLPS